MGIELIIFELILGIGLIGFFGGMIFRLPYLLLFGSILTALSGALIYIFDGLIVGHYYLADGTLSNLIVDSGNIGLSLFALVLIVIPIISFLVINFEVKPSKGVSAFHY